MHGANRLFVLLLAGLCIASCEREPAGQTSSAPTGPAAPECSLTMGWDPWEPYHYMDPKGNLQGLDVELVRAIAAEAGCSVSFERDNWGSLLGRIRSGEIDLISGATRTPDREKFALFSSPYRIEEFALFVRRGDAEVLAADSLAAMLDAGMKIGVTDAYLYGPDIEALQDDPAYAEQFIIAEVGETNATRLLDLVIDAYLEDVIVGTSIVRRRGLEQEVELHPLAATGGSDVRLMFSRQSVAQEIVARFDQALTRLRESGRYEEIEGQYIR
ncbi:MAG: transporter substrate-binding domain-containing protein [Gammaproteobacteria bacterium]